jgi:tRNA pseudouridine55 synthase
MSTGRGIELLMSRTKGAVLAVYKPPMVTSAFVTETIKSRVRLPVGHGGTLDMFAQGVLVLGVGSGTKQLSSFLHGEKSYLAEGVLGRETDSLDCTGATVSHGPWNHISRQDLLRVLPNFVGNILQVPPAFSALKVKGQRMSDLARKGVDVQIEPRPVVVHSLDLVSYDPPRFKVLVRCGGGFYVRSLIRDIARELDSVAVVSYLCRTKQGPFLLNDALELSRWTREELDSIVRSSANGTTIPM